MALASMTIDPNAQYLSDNDVVDKINNATTDITRANSVSAAARPIAAGEVGTTELDDGAVTNVKADSSLAKENLDAMADTDRAYIKTNPTSGEFKVVEIQRDDTGKLEITYDDVAVT